MELRNGTTVDDPRLGLLAQADPRNHDYKVAKADRGAVTWAVDNVLDQGNDGACVGYAFTHLLRAQGWHHPAIDEAFAWSIYTAAQKVDPWPGGEYAGAKPQMAGTSLLAGAKVLHRAGYFGEYRWASTVSKVRDGLMAGPGVLGCMWRASMDDAADGIVTVKGRRVGGHALLINGVDDDLFMLTNSWGGSWGDDGTAIITADDLAKLLRDDVGEVVFPSRHEHLTA